MHAAGKFNVKLIPLDGSPIDKPGININRMSLDKTFEGDLIAESIGEMISTRSAIEGSAGYIAMEQVSGTLNGEKGTFILQHLGTMQAGTDHLILQVSPDSGTEGLVGLSGEMTIEIKDGHHYYQFNYLIE